MTTKAASTRTSGPSQNRNGKLLVALPEPDLSMTQDAEWCVVRIGNEWRQYRFHDYDELYAVPGLYERIIYDVLKCDSPRVVRSLLENELEADGAEAKDLRVLDLGAGNGIVGEELAELGAEYIVGIDIINEAEDAANRDRPDVYSAYHVLDMTALSEADRQVLSAHRFNTMACVAALGFGDIPPQAFVSAFNQVQTGGWIAFNIKEDFLTDKDELGFAALIRRALDDGTLELKQRRRYQHRLATDGQPLHYVAIVGRKHRDIS